MDTCKKCRECSAELTTDDIAIYLKLITRGAGDYLCIGCLANQLKCSRKTIEDAIEYYKESGKCTLFRVRGT